MAEKRIFISYCRADAALANLLKAHLEEAQLPAWMDPDIRTGESWREAIDKAILEAKAVVVILSPRANASGYVNYEWAFALGAGLTVVRCCSDCRRRNCTRGWRRYRRSVLAIRCRVRGVSCYRG